jgi:MreB/Mrl family cell shape determining protein
MGLFSFTQELAMDLGTANSIIANNAGKILLDEPSIVALDRKTDKMIALGEKAQQMHGKTHENIRTVRPLRDGVIADFNAAEQMIRGMIRMANKNKGGGLFSPSLRVVICIPSGSTEVEIRAVRDSAEHAGGRDVYMIFEPMAAALGIGIDVEAPEGNMIVDIGGGTTDIRKRVAKLHNTKFNIRSEGKIFSRGKLTSEKGREIVPTGKTTPGREEKSSRTSKIHSSTFFLLFSEKQINGSSR